MIGPGQLYRINRPVKLVMILHTGNCYAVLLLNLPSRLLDQIGISVCTLADPTSVTFIKLCRPVELFSPL